MRGFGAVFADVRVDPDFGTVRVKRLVGAYAVAGSSIPRSRTASASAAWSAASAWRCSRTRASPRATAA
jgi:hypothetical protein